MKNPFDKFSPSAQEVLKSAQDIARAQNLPIATEHILLAVCKNRSSLAHGILLSNGITAETVEQNLSHVGIDLGRKKSATGLTADSQKALELAMKTALYFQHPNLDTEHLLLAVLSNPHSSAYKLVDKVGVNPKLIVDQINNLFAELMQAESTQKLFSQEQPFIAEEEGVLAKKNKAGASNALEYFTTDLTKKAQNGELDPLIGRENEIERLIKILSRRTKNNPVLIGEPGVGKTAIVEGFAIRIANSDVPIELIGKRVLSLDLASMVAGTMYRGQFEERIKKVLDEIALQNNCIIFIDELHTIVGAGSAEGALDAAQILKPSLAKGQLRLIGATTLDEYQKHIEKDAALSRRFQPIIVKESTINETIEILEGIKIRYEDHHNVNISDDAIKSAVILSQRYIADRFQPDKSIDILDETAATLKIKSPHDKKIITLMKKLETVIHQKEEAVTNEQYDVALNWQKQETKINNILDKFKTDRRSKRPTITKLDIEKALSILTGIPLGSLERVENLQMQNIEKVLAKTIIGQDEAISVVAKAIRRSRSGIGQKVRPIGSFIFLGPTGVGKTELAKTIAKNVFGREDALIKVDMSEFMERHNVSRLLGAPAGYVGYEEGGKLTEAIRRAPHSLILLDEIEKAHPEVFNILLQILEDGYVTDAKGRKVDFRNTLIIMSSNIGVDQLNKQAEMGFNAKSEADEKLAEKKYLALKDFLLKELKDKFKPEFLNRLDNVIIFKPLSKETVRKIADLQIEELITRAKELNIKLQVELSARRYIAEKGYDPENGARPIRRVIQEQIENKLADSIIANEINQNKTIVIRLVNGELNFI